MVELVTEQMRKQFVEKDEPVLFEAIIQKLSRWNFSQTRTLVVTTEHFYIYEGQNLSRVHNLAHIIAIVKSKTSNEVVLVFPSTDAKDIRIDGLVNMDELQCII